MLNKAQDVAVENQRLRREIDVAHQRLQLALADRKAAEQTAVTWQETTTSAIGSAQANLAALTKVRAVLDEQTRFLAGLDDLRWTTRDRIEKRAHVNRAMQVLQRDADKKAIDEYVHRVGDGPEIRTRIADMLRDGKLVL